MIELTLASQSPRRLQMLQSLGLNPRVQPADIDETPWPDEPALAHVQRLARAKCEAIDHPCVLAADTIVVCDEHILGKPTDADDFRGMMNQLSGRQHQVYTAWHLRHAAQHQFGVECTQVHFATLSPDMIEAYWASGEPADKAGGYGIQGWGGLLVERIEGDFNNVVGLPLKAVAQALAQIGLNPWRLDAR